MAVVKTNSNLIADLRAGDTPPDPESYRGHAVCATGTVANLATDNAGSLYHLCDLPAEAILDSRTEFDVTNWGFATVQVGTESDPTALINVLKSAGNTISPVAFGGANHGKKLWEVLGLAAPPTSGVIELYAYGPANAMAAGSMLFEAHYRWR